MTNPKALLYQWISALRSGNYLQTTGRLKKLNPKPLDNTQSHCHCCLGVLSEIVAPEDFNAPETNAFVQPLYQWRGETYYPVELTNFLKPIEEAILENDYTVDGILIDKVEFPSKENLLEDPSEPESCLVHLNDVEHFSFDQIAQVLEQAAKDLYP